MKKVFVVVYRYVSDETNAEFPLAAFTTVKKANAQRDMLNELNASRGIIHSVVELNVY